MQTIQKLEQTESDISIRLGKLNARLAELAETLPLTKKARDFAQVLHNLGEKSDLDKLAEETESLQSELSELELERESLINQLDYIRTNLLPKAKAVEFREKLQAKHKQLEELMAEYYKAKGKAKLELLTKIKPLTDSLRRLVDYDYPKLQGDTPSYPSPNKNEIVRINVPIYEWGLPFEEKDIHIVDFIAQLEQIVSELYVKPITEGVLQRSALTLSEDIEQVLLDSLVPEVEDEYQPRPNSIIQLDPQSKQYSLEFFYNGSRELYEGFNSKEEAEAKRDELIQKYNKGA